MATANLGSRHIGTYIDRPLQEVYDYASNPANMPSWAAGLGDSIEEVDGKWVVESSAGRLLVSFAPRNEFGVLDHSVTLPTGETFYNPVRVTADGDGCEVVFTLRRQPEMKDADYDSDAAAIRADLVTLKRLMESA